MNISLITLATLWLLFGFSHSLLADLRVKHAFYHHLGFIETSYRVFYNLFAFVFLTVLLYLQIVIDSTLIFKTTTGTVALALLIGFLGVIIMLLCILKYFKQLSGAFIESATPKLETGGLHQHVRHPLYLGTILFIIGLVIYFPYLKNFVAAFIVTGYTVVGAFFEERKLVKTFGEDYLKYQRDVPMLIPHAGRRKK